MQKNINVKNVKECVKKVNLYIYVKNYKVTSSRNVNKKINKTKKSIEKYQICIYEYIYIYIYMKRYKYVEIYVEKYLCDKLKSIYKYIKSI